MEKDQPFWSVSTKGIYNNADTWEAIRVKLPKVVWWKLIWFGLAIPKHFFILGLALRDSLITGRKMMNWGYKGDVNSPFCRGCIEEGSHLFSLQFQ